MICAQSWAAGLLLVKFRGGNKNMAPWYTSWQQLGEQERVGASRVASRPAAAAHHRFAPRGPTTASGRCSRLGAAWSTMLGGWKEVAIGAPTGRRRVSEEKRARPRRGRHANHPSCCRAQLPPTGYSIFSDLTLAAPFKMTEKHSCGGVHELKKRRKGKRVSSTQIEILANWVLTWHANRDCHMGWGTTRKVQENRRW
jgi:hypothetical protein